MENGYLNYIRTSNKHNMPKKKDQKELLTEEVTSKPSNSVAKFKKNYASSFLKEAIKKIQQKPLSTIPNIDSKKDKDKEKDKDKKNLDKEKEHKKVRINQHRLHKRISTQKSIFSEMAYSNAHIDRIKMSRKSSNLTLGTADSMESDIRDEIFYIPKQNVIIQQSYNNVQNKIPYSTKNNYEYFYGGRKKIKNYHKNKHLFMNGRCSLYKHLTKTD